LRDWPHGIELYAKVEFFNPLGSVKDRLTLGAIEAAECEGSLKSGQTVVEATSGNTDIGLAIVCARKRYPLIMVRWSAKPYWAGSGFTRLAVELADLPGHPARQIARRHKVALEAHLADLLAGAGLAAAMERSREIYCLSKAQCR
jgi:hypothetical protein